MIKVSLKIIASDKSKCTIQYSIISDIWQMPVILMVVVFLSSYSIRYITQMKRTLERIAKLDLTNVIGDLGMQTEDEGCCISQIADLCQKEDLYIMRWASNINCLKPIKIRHQQTFYQG